ncbi:MAG: heme-binding protein [Chloroflexi bacterium]|nr:heme-binding protein [Chloroflexota bacterium]
MNQRYTLSHHDAMRVLEVIRAELDRDGRGAAVAVADEHGELVALLRTDGCPLPSINNAINKAFVSAREGVPSGKVGQKARDEDWNMTNYGDLRYTGWGGGVPLIYQGQVVGAVGVSGLPEAEDVVLAELGAKALGGGAPSRP